MCGIVGFFYNDHNMVVDENMIQKMCRVIKHRGPDHTGIWCKGHAGLGMTRLSIIDRAGGFQPIHNEDKSMWIVFNGEIYNFLKLKQELQAKGHFFYTSSDTEVILHLYEEFGDDCVHRLRGMFAFAIWDTKVQKLFVARDRLGIKPLHYFFDGNRLIFGSEIKSILQVPSVTQGVDYQSLVNYFFYGYTPDPDSMFKGIRKLPPGHILVWQNGKLKVEQYWDVEYRVDVVEPEEFYIERSLELMREAVRIRLMSEVPLGAFLSGGVDSSLVVALMAQEMTTPVKTFSIGFEDQSYDELQYARMVAKKYGTDHHEEIVRPDAGEVILDLVHQFDEPFADSSAIPTYYVSKMTKKWVTVSLSGDGGDEVFGGYSRYLESRVTQLSRLIPGVIKSSLFKRLGDLMPYGFPGKNTLHYLSLSEDQQLILKYTGPVLHLRDKVFTSDFQEKVATINPSFCFQQYLDVVRGKTRLAKLEYLDTKTYLPGDILTKVDRTSMLVSLEARVPLLDHHLVEFAATIPDEYKVRNGQTKYLLKKIAERFLPPEVIYRPKQGFAVPLSGWILYEWKDMTMELLLGDRARGRGIFQKQFLQKIIEEHLGGRRDHAGTIWTLMVLELWFREHIDTSSTGIE